MSPKYETLFVLGLMFSTHMENINASIVKRIMCACFLSMTPDISKYITHFAVTRECDVVESQVLTVE